MLAEKSHVHQQPNSRRTVDFVRMPLMQQPCERSVSASITNSTQQESHDQTIERSIFVNCPAKLEVHAHALLNYRDAIRGLKNDESQLDQIMNHSNTLMNHRDEIKTIKDQISSEISEADLTNIEKGLEEKIETHSAALTNYRDQIASL